MFYSQVFRGGRRRPHGPPERHRRPRRRLQGQGHHHAAAAGDGAAQSESGTQFCIVLVKFVSQTSFFFQGSLHKLFHLILANSSSRERALDYLGEVLSRNAKRKQMQVVEKAVAGDGFMMNFMSVMQVGRQSFLHCLTIISV